MADADFSEGTVPLNVSIQHTDTPCLTYYKVVGDLSNPSPRLVVIHGGPGAGHEYLLPFGQLWHRFGIPVVFNDQIGCASSTHLPQTAGDESLWQEKHFFTELDNVLNTLQLRDGPGYHILGHSWDGRLAAAFVATRPSGLHRLILASGIASTQTYVEGIQILRKALSPDAQLALKEEEQLGKFDSPCFQKGVAEYMHNYFYRGKQPPPKELSPAMENMSSDKTVRETM